jgi:hypothetical protein
MAEQPNGDYYYDAGTINEQLEDFEVYEHDGRLYLNNEADGNSAIAFDGVAQLFANYRTSQPGSGEVGENETLMYVYDDGSDLVLQAAFNNGSSVVYTSLGTFSGEGGL